MAKLGAELLLQVLEELANGTAHETPQAADGVTYAAKLTRADRLIDWSQPAKRTLDRIRALSPAPRRADAIRRRGDQALRWPYRAGG
ncbi:MAG: hypothetical protein WDN72_09420 [Alphaproteobacteria bacterium]